MQIEEKNREEGRESRGHSQVTNNLVDEPSKGKWTEPVAQAFIAYDCMNQHHAVENYSLLEQNVCPVSDGNGESKTMVYGEVVQISKTASFESSGARLSKPLLRALVLCGDILMQ
jgi:hypothetical protein